MAVIIDAPFVVWKLLFPTRYPRYFKRISTFAKNF
jgi:hypothetical protein